jgi:Fe-S-cluster containining protein
MAVEENVENLCDKCAALCCRYIALPIDNPEDVRDYDNIRWYLMHENIVVFVEEEQWYIGIFAKCKHLQPDNRCGVYLTRPRICRGYNTTNCDYHGGDYNYSDLFTSADQLREYAERKLGRPLPLRVRTKPVRKRIKGKLHVELPIA